MAHHKRKRPRSASSGRSRDKHRKPRGDMGQETMRWLWLGCWPAWWDVVFHRRPHRAANHRLEREIEKGADPDELAAPVAKKPHHYYW